MTLRVSFVGVLSMALVVGCKSKGSSPSASDMAMGGVMMASDMAAGPRAYAVGVTSRTWVDSARPTPMNGTEPAKSSRTLATTIYYPTGAREVLDAGAAAAEQDAPVSPDGAFPLILFVHGSGGSASFYSDILTGMARAGFVVAAADFPLTSSGWPGGTSDLHVSDEVGDLSFLADELKAAAADTQDILHGAVDGLHYAVVGHSTGGAVAALAAFAGDDALVKHDSRVSAVVPLSGDACMFGAAFFKSRTVPILVVGATDDQFVRLPNSGQWVFDNTAAPHLLAKLVGGQHIYYTDVALPDTGAGAVPTGPTSDLATTLSLYGDASECLPEPDIGTDALMGFDVEHQLVIEVVTAYLDAQMRGESEHLNAMVSAQNPLLVFQQ